MKKVLFATSALVLASAAAHASEPLKLSVGGYYDSYVATATQDDDFNKAAGNYLNTVDVFGDGEIFFSGETMLDNGVKVGAMVELEAGTGDEGAGSMDESYVTVDTTYGRVIMGATYNAAAKMHVSAPDVGVLGVQESDLTNLILVPGAVTALDATWLNTDLKTNKLSYVSPTMYGLTFGASYLPGSDNAAAGTRNADRSIRARDAYKDGYALALAYSEEFAGVGVDASFGYANYAEGGKEHRGEYSTGLNLSYMGFTLGGSYRMVNDHTASVADDNTRRDRSELGGVASMDGYAYDLGVSYEAGPYGVSLNYFKSEVDGTRRQANVAANKDADKFDMYQLSGKYNLGAGVDTFATIGYLNAEDEAPETAANKTDYNKGWAFATGVALKF